MEREDLALGSLVGILEEDFAVDTAGTNQGRVESLDLVGCHDHLDVAAIVEAIQLIEKFKHGTLDFALATGCGFVPLRTDSVDFVNENNRRGIFRGDLVLLDKR